MTGFCWIGVVALVWAMMHSAPQRCPLGWWMPEGVRRSGQFVCRPKPVGDDERLPNGLVVDHSVQPPGEWEGDVYCTGGSVPIVRADGVSVGCQARH